MRITTVVITKNAGELLEDCLRSVSFCDELLIVDAGSTDDTVKIAKKYNARILEHDVFDFADMRNFALKHCNTDWIFYIDADERVSDTLKQSINDAITSDNVYVAYTVQRKNFYLGNHPWPKIELLERLFQRDKLEKWYGKLHESPIINGSTGVLKGYLNHYTHRNLSEMVTKTLAWSAVEAELRYKAGHPKMTWWRFPRVIISAFYDSYISQGGWKAGTVGVIESIYQSFSMFITYARLWEMQQKKNQ